MNDEYQTRAFHEVVHFHSIVNSEQGKPYAIALTEPNKREVRFLSKTEIPKIMEVKL
jgi:hypothetical protein